MNGKPLSLEDKIYLVKIEKFRDSHLSIRDQRVCRDCAGRECTTVCPVKTYEWQEGEARVSVAYENCFECGTCRVACPYENIEWAHPPGGYGVTFRYG